MGNYKGLERQLLFYLIDESATWDEIKRDFNHQKPTTLKYSLDRLEKNGDIQRYEHALGVIYRAINPDHSREMDRKPHDPEDGAAA